MSKFEYFESIANNPAFSRYQEGKARILWLLMAAFLCYYFALLIGAAYFRELFASMVFGHVNVGMLFALSQYVFAGVVAVYYANYMKKVDTSMQEFIDAHPQQ
jgi:uncharacterized membrane protein (DUF485 family)